MPVDFRIALSFVHRPAGRARNVTGMASVGALAGLCAAGTVQAETMLVPYVNSSTTYESNVFRLQDGEEAAALGNSSKSDVIFNNAIGLDAGFNWSNQRIFAKLEGSRFQYLNNDQLDQDAYALSAGMNWSLLSRISGTLTASNTQTRSSFANGDITVLNRQRQRDLAATTRFKLGNDLELDLGFSNNLLKVPAIGAPNFEVEQNTYTSSFNYVGINRLRVGVTGSYIDGDFRGTANGSRFVTYSGAGTIGYDASDISKFLLAVGYTTRDDKASQTKTEGLTGNLSYIRELTGKTSMNVSLTRSVDASDFGDNAVVNTGASVALTYSATARINATLAYSYLNSDFKAIGTTVNVFNGRTDDLHTVRLAAIYQAFDWLSISPSFAFEDRTTTIEGFDFDAFIVGMQFAAKFQ